MTTKPERTAAERYRSLLNVIEAAEPDSGRLAAYLRHRGLSGDVAETLLLHPALGYFEPDDAGKLCKVGTFPALVAPVVDARGELVCLHRTYLAADNDGKADVPSPKKLTPAIWDGANQGAAIRLAPAGSTLALAEGIETALAVMEATGAPAWACVSATGMESIDLPPEVRRVELWADNDPPKNGNGPRGEDAANKAAARLAAEGREVCVILPPATGTDWLDVYADPDQGPTTLQAARALAQPWESPGTAHTDLRGGFVDWKKFWDRGEEPPEWAFRDVLARGRGHALYAARKLGKSLFMLAVSVELATGPERIVVIYLDYEMGPDDLFDRLEDMGYGPSTDLSRLRYALLPTLAPLDTSAGAAALTELVDGVQAEWPEHHLVVVVDTFGRAACGAENDTDTVRAFYSHTGIQLKRRGITWIRLDHEGKDPTRGQRGASGKGDDVDVVWKLTKTENGICLERQIARMNWVPEKVTFGLTEAPLRYQRLVDDWPAGTVEAAGLLDRLNVPLDASTRAASAALKVAEQGRRRQVVVAALRWRRERSEEPR